MLIDFFIAYLAEPLAAGGSETEIFLDRITNINGETAQTSDFAAFGRGIVTINPKGDGKTSYPESVGFTAVNATDISLTGATRGLDKNSVSQTALKRYYPTGTPVIISVSSQTISDLKTYVDNAISGSVGTGSDTVAGTVRLTRNMGTLARAQAATISQQVAPNMTLLVGKFAIGDFIYTGGNTPAMVAPVLHSRIDLIAYDKVTSTIVTKTGTESTSPAVPQMSGDYIPLAYVMHVVGETSIKDVTDGTNGYIYLWCEPVLLEQAGFNKQVSGSSVPTGYVSRDGSTYSTHLYPELARALLGKYGYGAGVVATVNTSTDVVTATGHGLVNGDPVFFDNIAGSLPGGITANTLYYVITAATNNFQIATTIGGSAVNITSTGSGTTTAYGTFKVPDLRGSFEMGAGTRSLALTFDSTQATQVVIPASIGTISSVNAGAGALTTSAVHGFATGDAIYFTGSLPSGLTASTIYFAIVTGTNTLTLATSYENALAGVQIASFGSATTGAAVFAEGYFNSPRAIPGWVTTGVVIALTTAGTAPTGLSAGTYYAITQVANPSRIYLASSLANAYQNIPVPVTGAGTGVQTLTAALAARSVGDSGGEDQHHLTIREMPSHFHTLTLFQSSSGNSGQWGTATSGGLSNSTSYTGGDSPHNNEPPFTVGLAVIRY